MAEIFQAAEYETAGFVAAAVLDRKYGLDQGFGHYDDKVGVVGSAGLFQYPRKRGDEVVRSALDWLDSREPESRTFIWVHLFDPHAPYEAPEPERSRYPDSAYVATIAFADRVVGELIEGYRERGRFENSIIVVTSDHGESLGEHGEATHGVFVYDSTLRVPLVMRGPGIPRGRLVDHQVGLVDVMPTVCALAGLETPAALDGRKLLPLLRLGEEAGETPPIYIESYLPREQYGWSELRGLRNEKWKLITGVKKELYDLEEDPGEDSDVASREPDRVGQMSESLVSLSAGDNAEVEGTEIDEGTRRQMAALGYLSSSVVQKNSRGTLLPDPRERIGTKNRMTEAINLFALGQRKEAIAAYRQLVGEEPTNLLAQSQLGDLLALVGRYEEARAAFRAASDLAPEDARLRSRLAHCFERLGRHEEAKGHFEQALAIDPDDREARERRWNIMQQQDLSGELEREARAFLARDPNDVQAYLALAFALQESAGEAAMQRTLEDGLSRAPGDIDLMSAMAAARVRSGELEEGMIIYRQVLAVQPAHRRAASGLARVLLHREDLAAAREVLERAAETAVINPEVQYLLAQARARQGDLAAALPLAEEAAAVLPGDAKAWATLGSVRLMAGNDEGAAEAYRRALSLRPDDRTTGLNLASTYERLGLPEEARKIRERYQSDADAGD
jgi:tetratricopeptide (TPR) repeat protein